MSDDQKCPLCGKAHEGRADRGITTAVCRSVPEGFVWVDQAFKSGPRGALFALKDNAR